MPAFLAKLTEHIYAAHTNDLGNISIVLPNRRAILYIKNQLSQIITKTTFLPEFFSIEDFVGRCSGLVITDQLGDQFRLYAIHRQLEGKNARSIEEFLPYASWMLSDFNEIDMYLVDKDKLYGYLTDTKAMTLWNPDGRPLSELEQQYLGFYRSLQLYYEGLNQKLASDGLAYQGSAFRQLSENIEIQAENWPWEKTYFAGFNALTPSESKIIRHLIRESKAEVLWDADRYYLDNKDQEAGYFLREYFNGFDKERKYWIEDNFSEKKNISVIGAPGNTGQLKYAGEILKKIVEKQGNLDKTALVLADESLLLPMLNSIPPEAGKFNVTMGLALKQTPLYSLLDTFLGLHRSADRFAEIGSGRKRAYYAKDLIRLAQHPWFNILIADHQLQQSSGICDTIRNSNRVFFPADELNSIFGDLAASIGYLYASENDAVSLTASLSRMLDGFRKIFIERRDDKEKKYTLELEYIFRYKGLVQRLQDLLKTFGSIKSAKTLQLIFRQLSQQERIAFKGEPLAGLQVMGMLETRALDFETVIMLSVNEGTLPAARLSNSFIPFDIKNEKAFRLPTFRHNNRVFAYHFYRLLQRAKKTYLLYNTESDALGGGEKSRFITQLQHEVPTYNSEIKLREQLLTISPPSGIRDTCISIEKNKEVRTLLSQEAEKGFHPSSLSKYINCPLQFYLARIAKVEDAEEIEETIDARTLGIVAHESLRKLLLPHLDKTLSPALFKDLKKLVDKEVDIQFAHHFQAEDISYGKNYLVVGVTRHMLKQLLDREAEWLEEDDGTRITALEQLLSTSYDIPGTGRTRFRGTADRIDIKGKRTRIIDYKTGSVDERKLKPASWEKLFSDPDYQQAFQLIMYAWLYHRENPGSAVPSAGIISLKMPGNGAVLLKPPGNHDIEEKSLEEFESNLIELIKQIFDPGIPFKQTEDEKRCKYCSFKEICNRSLGKNEY